MVHKQHDGSCLLPIMQQNKLYRLTLARKLTHTQVMGTVTELYTFMDGADGILERRVLGEGAAEGGEGGDAAAEEPGAESLLPCLQTTLSHPALTLLTCHCQITLYLI